MPRIVDELHEPLGRKLIRQPLHALTAGGAHLGDLRHGERTKQREASHEAERTAAPTGDEPCLLAEGPDLEEALGHFEHQLGDRLGLAVDDWARPRPSARRGPVSCRRHRLRSPCLYQFFQLTPWLSTSRMTPWLSCWKFEGADMEMDPAVQRVTDAGTAGPIARPPLLFLGALLIGFVLNRLLRLPFPVPGTDLVHWIIGGSLILIGLALAAAGIRNFSRAGTPVRSIEPTRALVTTGIHGWTRNPIYLG